MGGQFAGELETAHSGLDSVFQVGIAGLIETWTIYADGRVTHSDGREWLIADTQTEELERTLETADFFSLNGNYLPADPCCDRFTYTITVQRDGEVHRVVTMDGVEDLPPALEQAMQEIDTILGDLQ